MDDYPEHLAPEFDEWGGVATPFEEWRMRVRASFPTVPEDAARYWLHENWKHSPFSYLRSADYSFEPQDWQANLIHEIRSRWCNYDPTNQDCRKHGEHVLKNIPYRTATYMRQYGFPPARLIVLDNRDGHLVAGEGGIPSYEDAPAEYILIEGHRRFNMALAHQAQGLLKHLPIWLMKRTWDAKSD